MKNIKKYITNSRIPFYELVKPYISEKTRILDIGSGDASFARYLNRKDVFMLEGNPDSVKRIREDFENVTCSTLPDLPYEKKSFDLIHASHIVEHLLPQDLYILLKNIDDCLADGGYLVISAPLLHDNFYCDLSHIKPYYPSVFINYLTGKNVNRTRSVISKKYQQKELVYRYKKEKILLNNVFITWILKILNLKKLTPNGFTLVLQKQNIE